MTQTTTTPVQDTIIEQIATARRFEDRAPMFMFDATQPTAIRVHTKPGRGRVANFVVTYDASLDLYHVLRHTFRSGAVGELTTDEFPACYADQMANLIYGRRG